VRSPADLQPVELGHEDIEDDRVGRAPGEHVERLLAVLGQRHIVVFEPQGPLESPPNGRLIVHYQYARHRNIIAATRKCR